MGFTKRLRNIMSDLNDFAVNGVGKVAGNILNKGAKAIPTVTESVAGGLNTTIKAGKKVASNMADGTIWKNTQEFVGKANKKVWTNPDAYKKVGNLEFSNQFLFGDDLNRRAKGFIDKTAGIIDGVSKDNINVMGATIPNPVKLLKKNDKSLLGVKATKRGALLAGGVMFAAGVPQAGKQYIENRQGTNMDSQPMTSAPRLPAYAQDGGATGDLVFALNNLRHGGMM